MIHWSQKKISAFQQTLLAWYDQQKRDLPWRHDHDPYHVWISEIMLQQTQVQTVIPYYNRFMKQFPNVQSLAEANEDDLMKAWEGLGYYSRARNLQKAANQLVHDYGGKWPTTVEGLQSLSGIGPYTAGAIGLISPLRRLMVMPTGYLPACLKLMRTLPNPKRESYLKRLLTRSFRRTGPEILIRPSWIWGPVI